MVISREGTACTFALDGLHCGAQFFHGEVLAPLSHLRTEVAQHLFGTDDAVILVDADWL